MLSSRYAPMLSEGAPESPERLLNMAAVRDNLVGAEGRQGAYEVRLSALAKRHEIKLQAGRPNPALLLLQRCRKLIELGNRIPGQGRSSEMLQRWWTALADMRFFEAIRGGEQRAEEETPLGQAVLGALGRDQAAAEALQALASELEGALKLTGAGPQAIHRRTFHSLLLDAASDFNLLPHGPRGAEVHVLDLRELSGRRFAKVLIGGLVDGRFPMRRMPHALFPDEDRARINKTVGRSVFRLSAGEGDSLVPWRLAEDRLLLFLALCSADEQVVLSYARQGRDGQEQIASPFLEELRRLTGCGLVPIPTQPAPVLDDVASETELRERVAIEVLSRPELRASEPDRDRSLLSARFQIEEWLAKARELANIEEERLRFFSSPKLAPGAFTGWAGAPELRSQLSQLLQFGPERPLSASTLKRFGECAFRGFLALAVGLEEPDVADEQMDARGTGSFWHRVLEELFTRLKAAGLIRRSIEEVPQQLIDEALEIAASAAAEGSHVGHPLLWGLDRERARSMVIRLLRSEHRGLPFEGLSPNRAELLFGREGAEEAWREVRLPDLNGGPDVWVGGKIDRLDSGPAGLGVIDYKSGRILSGKELAAELLTTEFQLPLYLHAVRSIGNRGTLHAALLSLKSGKLTTLGDALQNHGDVSIDDLVSTDADRRTELEKSGKKNLANAVHALLGELRAGNFAIRPRDCSYCSFQPVCRVTERRFEQARRE
jgi:ATP-dependent helicase/DNAse subunit B